MTFIGFLGLVGANAPVLALLKVIQSNLKTLTHAGGENMPSWTTKDERQYDAITEQLLDDGKSTDSAQEIAARTVNKRRREEGRTPNKTTQGTGNPNTRLEERTVDELRNIAREMKIEGRSKLTRKDDLIAEIRKRR